VDAVYTCLSYRWGDPDPSRNILVNGKPFTVRQNLFDFLTMVQTKAAAGIPGVLGPYWIDALSIDQLNVPERNHQVAQVGKIFSNAVNVYLWLGLMTKSMSSLLRIFQNVQDATFEEWGIVRSHKDMIVKNISENEYWTRAWIAQEILNAHHVTVWLDAEFIGLSEMIKGMQYFYLINESAQDHTAFAQFTTGGRMGSMRQESLISLLAHFRDKQCHDPRDRIFSLLSLCSNEGRQLKIDYNISTSDLAVQVLLECKQSYCFYSAVVVAQALRFEMHNPRGIEHTGQETPYIEFDVARDFVGPNALPLYRYLHSYHRPKPPEGYSGHGYNFQDTCESASLDGSHIACDEPAATSPRMAYWNHTSHVHPLRAERHRDDFELRQNDDEEIFDVRLPLRLLASMVGPNINLCRHAIQPRTRRRDVQIGYPQICYASGALDHVQQVLPPLDTSFVPSLEFVTESIPLHVDEQSDFRA
jgi:hypothetical protein